MGNKKLQPKTYTQQTLPPQSLPPSATYSPFTFTDILPLVEFEVHPDLSHERVVQILLERETEVNSAGRQNTTNTTNNWSEKIDLNSQTLEVYSNDSLTTEYDTDRIRIFNYSDEINPATNMVILNESQLSKLTLSSVIMINDNNRRQHCYRYYLNMMPQIGITACNHCNQVSRISEQMLMTTVE